MQRFFIQTHGCQMNEYDSGKICDVLMTDAQMQPTDDPLLADVLLLNTCSVREKAQEKVFSQLGRWRQLKQRRPEVLIGVGGCVASQEGEALRARAPFVDVIFGPQTLHRLPQMLSAARIQGATQMDVSFPEIEKFDHLPPPRAEGPVAFVSVMEGCSKYCAYCVVPYTRGAEVSRPCEDILREISALAAQGVREVTLLGQNVNAYEGLMDDGGTGDLALLMYFVSQIAGIERIRFTTSHPLDFSPSLIEAFAEIPALASHVHLPVQSGSDRILAAMKRGHTALEYKSLVRKLRQARPDILISSDFIVGFPGETEEDFAATLRLIEDVDFDQSFSFVYSRRPGTPAAMLADAVTLAEKKTRLMRLQSLLNARVQAHSEAMLGQVVQVLVEGPSKKDPQWLTGRSSQNRVINFPAASARIGQTVAVRITDALTNTLRGELV
ncbi:tRNA (N6-isopentenyl adenosine(37)-C2)-methylthiotransferase MiaB [Thiorhodospira sibirica]|uniref:tRNA (N6-isopentenyl adenosine(37)-C2)-methylthiotransferase MiaB n=1 Tax=Thiorhodospira sibirica TaxID=154347 RepID=UPI00022C171A|nr:tRNA (N6-isopentenyl adenosine(37)-C2)-methylthiotransferase MiaB [Thiorhodospira sibirica]